MPNVSETVEKLRAGGHLEKVAKDQGGLQSSNDEAMEKLAANLKAGGALLADGFIDRLREKLAEAPVSASGQAKPSQGDASNDDSMFKKIEKKIFSMKGHESGGTAPSVPGTMPTVAAETTAPPQDTGNVNKDLATG